MRSARLADIQLNKDKFQLAAMKRNICSSSHYALNRLYFSRIKFEITDHGDKILRTLFHRVLSINKIDLTLFRST